MKRKMDIGAREKLKHYITMVAQGYVNCLLCQSKTGLGKTYTTIQELKRQNVKHVYCSGVTTAVSLYKMMYDNNGMVLVLDDIETMFKDDRIVNLLKSALWAYDNDVRRVGYATSSKALEGYPDNFEYTGRIIILMNDIMGFNNESFNALMSRTLTYRLQYTAQEVKNIAMTILDNRDDLTTQQKQKCKGILRENVKPEHKFNFRILERLITFVKYDVSKARELFCDSLDKDDDVEVLRRLSETCSSVEEQVREFTQSTGKSRATFYRLRKQMTREGLL